MSRSIREVVKEFGPIFYVSEDEKLIGCFVEGSLHIFSQAPPNSDFERFPNEIRWSWIDAVDVTVAERNLCCLMRDKLKHFRKLIRKKIQASLERQPRVKEPGQ